MSNLKKSTSFNLVKIRLKLPAEDEEVVRTALMIGDQDAILVGTVVQDEIAAVKVSA